jgi:hypothetical protein
MRVKLYVVTILNLNTVLKNGVFCDVTPCDSCKNRRFIRVTRIGELGTTLVVTSNRRTVRPLLVTASVPSSPILVTLKKAGPKFLRNVGSYKSRTA